MFGGIGSLFSNESETEILLSVVSIGGVSDEQKSIKYIPLVGINWCDLFTDMPVVVFVCGN